MNSAPLLLFGYGNVARGDDGLGPLLIEALEPQLDARQVSCLTDFQLQIEHMLDMQQRQVVVFIDAAVDCPQAFALSRLQPVHDNSYTSHAMTPAALLLAYQTTLKSPPPPCFLLRIQGQSFALGDGLSPLAASHLQHALAFVKPLLPSANAAQWQRHCH